MDAEIKFVTHDIGVDVVDDLLRRRVIRSRSGALLKAAMKHGGYIAGGFGTIVARQYFFGSGSPDDFYDAIRNHLRSPEIPREGQTYANAGVGDIDVWFPSAEAIKDFERDPDCAGLKSDTDVRVTTTLTGAATEYLIEKDARVQVINRWVQPLIDQIGSFDIYNAMVAIQGNMITVPEHWHLLESANQLHVSTWASKWTMNRFFKWVERKRWYESVTPATAEHVYNQVIKIIEWKQKWHGNLDVMRTERVIEQIKNDKLRKRVVMNDAYRMQGFLKPIISSLLGEKLLQLSTFFPEPLRYDLAMKEIHRRIPVK